MVWVWVLGLGFGFGFWFWSVLGRVGFEFGLGWVSVQLCWELGWEWGWELGEAVLLCFACALLAICNLQC